MPRSHHYWHQFFADGRGNRARRRGGGAEAHADRPDLVDDVVAWITAYLDNGASNDDDRGRDDRRAGRRSSGRTARTGRSDRRMRHLNLDDLFEDGSDPSVWPDEIHEHLAALRDRLHGILARQYGRRRGKHPRWGRRREGAGERETEARDAAHSHASRRPRRLAWAVATRLAVLAITAVVARGRAERSRRRRGFSV